MDFKKRKDAARPIVEYLNSNDCSIENLLGLKAVLQALDVAVSKRLRKVVKERDKMQSKLKIDDEKEWLD